MYKVDATLIEDSIGTAALCADCIAFRVGIPRTEVDAAITSYGHSIVVTNVVGRCAACLKESAVHRLG